ncbi:MBOAT, membrane-bound O-acyltransferase family-domain-containing protein [Syncephalis plumigaleata]|nr:MBOAT, membrane-bound O-acyltransferase family-domain-containing protein [Syncephalis plumigaleata]
MLPKIPVDPLPQLVGIPEQLIRLLIVLLSGYPIAYVYRAWALPRWTGQPGLLNAYNAVCGLFLSYFFCGPDIFHSLLTVATTHLITTKLAPRNPWLANKLLFVWNMGYLLWGYYSTQTAEYSLNWTCPQCILCLKLIGYGFDVCDGQLARLRGKSNGDAAPVVDKKQQEDPSVIATRPFQLFDDKTCPLAEVPSLARLIGFSYHPMSFLVGPQISFSYYENALQRGIHGAQDPVEMAALRNNNNDNSGKKTRSQSSLNSREWRVIHCFTLAVLYMCGTQVIRAIAPVGAMLTPEAEKWSFLYKVAYMAFSLKGVLMQYLGVWLMSEGACVMSGLGYNGISDAGTSKWDGLANVYPGGFESATELATIIATFNVNTNRWTKRYIFKRLRFLGSKQLSAFGALFFLAIWHGFHPGYFLTFGMEYIDMEAERHVVMLWRRMAGDKVKFTGLLGVPRAIIGWLWTSLHLTYGLATMELRVFTPGWEYWRRVHFFSFWLSIGLVVFCNIVSILFRPGPRPATITKVVTESVVAKAQEKLPETKGRIRRASVLEEVDELTIAADNTVSKVNELINTISTVPNE